MHIMHAALLALGVVAIALAAEIIFASGAVFWLAGDSGDARAPPRCRSVRIRDDRERHVLASTASRRWRWCWPFRPRACCQFTAGGTACSDCCASRGHRSRCWRRSRSDCSPSTAFSRCRAHRGGRWAAHVLVFALAWVAIVGPWLARNAVSVGTWGLDEEYGSAALIERFAYDDMSAREFAAGVSRIACRTIGEPVINWAFGPAGHGTVRLLHAQELLSRRPAHRDKAGRAHGRLDPLIKRPDPRRDARPAAGAISPVSVPLAWCGLWVGGLLGARAGAAVRVRLRHGRAPVEAAVPALRDAAPGDARIARRGRQPLHALQSDPDRPVLRRRRLGYRGGGRRLAAAARYRFVYSSVTPPVLITLAHLSVSSAIELAEVGRAYPESACRRARRASPSSSDRRAPR